MIVTANKSGLYIQCMMSSFPKTFVRYVEKHLEDGVVHMFYGSKMMSRRWSVIPYELGLNQCQVILNNMNVLSVFKFMHDVDFVLYNATNRLFSFDGNVTVVKV